MEYIAVFIFGIIIGSFLNVCIYRMPLGRSVVTPRSYCPFCGKGIAWFDNIPLLSYVFLKARCRNCSRPISIRYFMVELVTGLSGILAFFFYSLSVQFFVYWAFFCALIIVIGVDIEHQEIPDEISLPGILIGVVLMTAFRLDGSSSYLLSVFNSVLGILAGGGSMFLMGMAGELVFKKEALGGGDVKLMAMIGAFIGWKLVLLTFFLAPVLGAGIALFMKIRFKKEVIAYGPYLSIAAVLSLLCGDRILDFLFPY